MLTILNFKLNKWQKKHVIVLHIVNSCSSYDFRQLEKVDLSFLIVSISFTKLFDIDLMYKIVQT